MLALYIYPLPKGTEYTPRELLCEIKVAELFNYCQILEGLIYKKGWEYLIAHYGYEKLYQLDQESDWHSCEDLSEYIECLEMEISSAP